MIERLEQKLRFVKYRAGSALVLVIVITVLLATVGVMFVVMSRLGQVATSAIADNRELSAAVDVVVKVEFPLNSGNYYWPHISDISEIPGNWWLSAVIAVEPTDVNDSLFEGIPADADGDGVEDSRWVRLPITSSRGRPIFAAVRIIDNCGMININTAYRDPTGSLDPCDWPDWDGSLLTHINLETDMIHNSPIPNSYRGFIADGDVSDGRIAYHLQVERCGRVVPPASDIAYHNYVALRLLNPILGYTPFDIGDELELRNRFFLSSPVINRFGYKDSAGVSHVLQVTLDPGDSPTGKGNPYDSPEHLDDWFAKATGPEPGTGICNRRHIATTYSFDRILRPYDDTPLPDDMADTSGQRKFGIQLPLGIANGSAPQGQIDQYIRQLAGAIYRGLPGDSEIADRFGDYTRETLSWQFAVNLIDYQDNDTDTCSPDDDEPTYYKAALADDSEVEFWGVENVECIKRDTIFISEVAYVNFDSGDAPPPPSNGEYFAIELFNPDTQPKQPWTTQDYYIVIESGSPISLDNAGVPQLNAEEAVVLTNADLPDVPLIYPTLVWPGRIYSVTGLGFNPDDEIVIYKEDWPTGSDANMPVDRIVVPGGIVEGVPANVVHAAQRNQTLGPTTDNLLWAGTDMWADSRGILDTLGAPPTPPDLVESDPNMHVQLAVTNEPLRTLGEIENVFAVGYGPNHSLIGSIEAIYEFSSAPELGLDMRRYGRINLADPNYRPLLDFLTYFDPSSDGVDNDGRNGPDDYRDGPQKRMIAIFDRSNVFSPADRPRLVALHPVPDPR